jgi:hypothetical protein
MMALEKVRERLDGQIIEQLARDMHESMRGPVEAGKVLFRKPCVACGHKGPGAIAHEPTCDHCKGTRFEPFEEFDQLPPIVREGRIMAAKWLFDHYILQRRIPKA